MKKQIIIYLLFAFIISCIFIFQTGCGKKGPPLPPLTAALTAPFDLTYDLTGNSVTLEWASGDQGGDLNGFKGFEIVEAKIDLSENHCKGCPVEFKPFAAAGPDQLSTSHILDPGFRYYYRVRAVSKNNHSSSFSNTVQFELK